jgi:hypothetical protein
LKHHPCCPNSSATPLSFSHADASLLPRQIASRDFHSLIKAVALVGSLSAAYTFWAIPRRRTGKEKVVLHGAAFVWSRTTSCRGTASASRLREVLLNFGLVGIERRGGNLNSELGFCRISGKSGGVGGSQEPIRLRWRSPSDVKITRSNLTWSDELFGVIIG